MYNRPNDAAFVKDGINDHIVHKQNTVNLGKIGTKSAIWLKETIASGESKTFTLRLSKAKLDDPWTDFDEIFTKRIAETDQYYNNLTPAKLSKKHKALLRSSMSGLLWTKQFYYLDVFKWLFGEPNETPPFRYHKRNFEWQHLTCRNIIAMPDKWEYPWFAAWDLAFHAATFVHMDPFFAKQQLLVVLREYYMHPNGQIPAYEWNFSDVNPPVHAWSVWYVFEADKKKTGVADWDFLERSFQKLLMNFTWWVNQKDSNGTDIFEGGFLGLDNIGVFDRNLMPQGIKKLQQADATSWMAMYSINMLRISLELAQHNLAYEESAAKFFRHFLNIGWAMHHIGKKDISLWDDEDQFYYDLLHISKTERLFLRVRSMVGLIPLLAVETIEHLENPWAFMRALVRLARPGGWVIVTTPNQLSALSLITLLAKRRFSSFQDGHYPAHRTALLEVDLRRIAGECALENPEIGYSHSGRVPLTGWHYPAGLARLSGGEEDRPLLAPLWAYAASGRTPADELLEEFDAAGGDPAKLVPKWELVP